MEFQLLHEVWASVMETQVFDAGSEPPLVSVCVSVCVCVCV